MQRSSSNNHHHKRRVALVRTPVAEPQQTLIPPHLGQVSWIHHEHTAARAAFKDLSPDLKALKKKVTAARVHKARVTLRRWLSLWNVLRRDGWESHQYKEEIGRPLKKLQRHLGALRDLDVNIEQGERLGCNKRQLKAWSRERDKAQKRLTQFVEHRDIGKILQKLSAYLRVRPHRIAAALPAAKSQQSAFDHIEFYLLHQESIVREQANSASTPEEFHELRLAIKRWRYLLTEFFGLTNLELVRAQQILGQMHDLDRLTPLLEEAQEEGALDELRKRRKELMHEIELMRTRLPYGLRPVMCSFESAKTTGVAH